MALDDARAIDARVDALVAHDHERLCAHTDRQFALLLLVQWLFSVVLAVNVSPLTWSGRVSAIHPHVWAAAILGGLIVALPVWLARTMPGRPVTRYAVAIAQMSVGILLIHITDGRIETHFHVFGSLAFLAAYRDCRVLATATLIVVIDHVLRGVVWPQSIFGVAATSAWRPLEHAAWVLFEDAVLLANCMRATAAARLSAAAQIGLIDANDTVEARVERRTAELVESRQALERANAELREATAQALESSRTKSAFLATVSHEVRTPMNGIIGVAELLRDTPLEAEQVEYVDIIDRSGHALLGIINDILDFSKLEAGKLEVEVLEFDLLEQLDHVITVLAPAAAHKGIALGAIVGPDVPRRIVGDSGRIGQVLLNLVGNAVKFTEQGRVVVLLSRPDDTSLRFDVEDTGPGVAAAAIDRLFQPFTQADASTTRRFGGTGLGLAICRSLAELLGGTLSATSTLGAGSTFRFELPLQPAVDAVPAITAVPALPSGRTLVVSGSAEGAALVSRQLHQWGFETDVASEPPADRAGEHGLVIGYQLDDHHIERLRQWAPAGVVLLRAPLTPLRLLRQLAGDPGEAPAATRSLPGIVRASGETDVEGPYALVVEDNPVNQRIAIKMMTRLGYRTHTATNGVEATRRAQRHRYDVILMDCQMPEMDGFAATRAIRDMEASAAHTPIIALTANAMASDRDRCLAAGMDDFLSKPLTLAALQQAIERIPTTTTTRADRSAQSQASDAPV